MRHVYTAVIESASDGGYVAYCPEVSGANGQGESIDAAKRNLGEAIELILEDREEAESLP